MSRLVSSKVNFKNGIVHFALIIQLLCCLIHLPKEGVASYASLPTKYHPITQQKLTASDGWSTSSLGGYGGATAVTADGTVIAVGCQVCNTSSGIVFVYSLYQNNFILQSGSPFAPSDRATDDYFGKAVAISDDGALLIVGGPGAGASYTGGIWFYKLVGSTWTQWSSKQTFSTIRAFGFHVVMSKDGTTAAATSFTPSQSLVVYTITASTFTVQQTIAHPYVTSSYNELINQAMDMSGDGSTIVTTVYDSSGYFVVFVRNSTNVWNHFGGKYIFSPGSGSISGVSVVLSGDGSRVIMGSSGAVSFWNFENGDYTSKQVISKPTGATSYFGFGGLALYASATRLIVGDMQADQTSNGNYIGGVFFYELSGTTWSLVSGNLSTTNYKLPFLNSNLGFGGSGSATALSVSDWGTTLLIGAYGDENGKGSLFTYQMREATAAPSRSPSRRPSNAPSRRPSKAPIIKPTASPVIKPTLSPTSHPTPKTSSPLGGKTPTTLSPTQLPSRSPVTSKPSRSPSTPTSFSPTSQKPSQAPSTKAPTSQKPTQSPTTKPSFSPTQIPTTGSPVLSNTPTTHSPVSTASPHQPNGSSSSKLSCSLFNVSLSLAFASLMWVLH